MVELTHKPSKSLWLACSNAIIYNSVSQIENIQIQMQSYLTLYNPKFKYSTTNSGIVTESQSSIWEILFLVPSICMCIDHSQLMSQQCLGNKCEQAKPHDELRKMKRQEINRGAIYGRKSWQYVGDRSPWQHLGHLGNI